MPSLPPLPDLARAAFALARGTMTLKLRANVRIGDRPQLSGKVKLNTKGSLVIGDRFIAAASSLPVSVSVMRGATLTIGDNVYLNNGASIVAWHDIRIGNNVLFAPLAAVTDDARHEVEPGAPTYHGPTVIEDNVWLGRQVFVTPGVRIGAGSVIAAGSVVTKDIPPASLAGGSPAKVIRDLDLPEGWVRK